MYYLIGIDIGGTSIKMGLFSIDSKTIIDFQTKNIKREDSAYMEVKQNICCEIKEMLHRNMLKIEDLKGIGVSIAANFEYITGKVTRWPNNSNWNGFPLKDYLIQCFHIPVILEDDANCAAFGEFISQDIHNESLIYCTLGTGIGMGIIIENKIYRGQKYFAGDIGHVKIYGSNVKCICGGYGCLQAIFQKEKKKMGFNYKHYNGYMNNSAKQIAYCLYQMAYLLDIRVIIVGGGVVEHNVRFFEIIERYFYEFMDKDASLFTMKKSDLYNKNGVYGALQLISQVVNNNI